MQIQKIAQPNDIVASFAKEFYSTLPLNSYSNILDFGCRDGRVTHAIAEMFPNVKITGLDKNKDFIETAQKYKNERTQFFHAEYEDLQFQNEYDAVVSFSCLNWLSEEGKINAFQKIKQILKPNGKAYLKIFADHGRPRFDRCIFTVADREEWKKYFTSFTSCDTTKTSEFLALSEKADLIFENAKIQTHSYTFENKESFKKFINTWNKHPLYLPENLREAFLDQVVDQYGTLIYTDYCLELTLTKKA